ncbi:MAG: hypothetical protein ABR527_00030 [Gemmatimonadota bacterium]
MILARAKWASALVPAALIAACDGNGTTEPDLLSIIAVGIVRFDASPDQALTGYLAFFYDPAARRLLDAEVRVNTQPLTTTIQPGIVSGPLYIKGGDVQPNTTYRLTATVQSPTGPVEVVSQSVVTPAEFEVRAPAQHPLGQALELEWDPILDAQGINVAVTGNTFEANLPGTATSITIPGSALTVPGVTELEVTAFNGFYVSLSSGISTLADAEAAALRFTEAQNVTGPGVGGSFGAATTIGIHVDVQ